MEDDEGQHDPVEEEEGQGNKNNYKKKSGDAFTIAEREILVQVLGGVDKIDQETIDKKREESKEFDDLYKKLLKVKTKKFLVNKSIRKSLKKK